jgi:hypothetical protein
MPQLILERIGLLEESKLRCPSVMKVEGLRSYKAIAFIRSGSNPRVTSLETKTYSILRTSLQKAQSFSKITFLVRKSIREYFNENQVMKNG